MISRGGPDPLFPTHSESAHTLHPPVSKSRANVLLIFQCPSICPIPPQVDILVSDDSLVFCPTMYNSFYLGRDKSQIRIKSEVGTVKHVEVLQSFFLPAQISTIVFLNVKKSGLYPVPCVCVCVCACACVCVCGGGGTRRYNHLNIYHDPLSATVSRVSTGVGGWDSGYQCISLSQRVLVACAKQQWK